MAQAPATQEPARPGLMQQARSLLLRRNCPEFGEQSARELLRIAGGNPQAVRDNLRQALALFREDVAVHVRAMEALEDPELQPTDYFVPRDRRSGTL